MSDFRIGDVSVASVWELDDTSFDLTSFFPLATQEAVTPELHWLAPDHYDPATGRIRLSMHAWLVDTGRSRVLIDACIGNDKNRLPRQHWTNLSTPFLDRLKARGVAPEDIDFVMCTHLHADHVGWNTRLIDGRWVPTFPNARYIFARREYDFWSEQYRAIGREGLAMASYVDSVLPVVEAGQALIVDDTFDIDGCLTIDYAPGHTPGHVAIWLRSGGASGVFSGDIVHHPLQLLYPQWSCHGCASPDQATATRRSLLERICDTPTKLLTGHFIAPHAGAIRSHRHAFMIDFLCDVC